MPVPVEERYKQMFEEHRFASDIRFKILAAWGAVYVALAGVFLWAQSTIKPFSWAVTSLALVATVIFWLADIRNRPAIGGSKAAGAAIESDPTSEIPEEQRFFSRLEEGIPHRVVINLVAGLMTLLFAAATVYLICSRGELPR